MMPDCDPVNDTAGSPSSPSAMASSDTDTRSPVDKSMSSSRGFGLLDSAFACESSPSVVLPIADTTAHTR